MAGCELSPSASAFSAILSALVGSVINGLTSGWLIAFMTGWISWLAVLRVLVGGSYMFWRSITDTWGPGWSKENVDPDPSSSLFPNSYPMTSNRPPGDDAEMPLTYHNQQQFSQQTAYPSGWHAIQHDRQVIMVPKPNYRELVSNIWPSPAVVRGLDQREPSYTMHLTPEQKKHSVLTSRVDLDRGVTVLGWIGLGYTAIFAPITQILFLAAHLGRHDDGPIKLVKGLTVAITALPLCIDPRVRYADSLRVGRRVFNLVVSTSCLLQGGICATLLVRGVLDLKTPPTESRRPPPATGPPTAVLVPIYLVFSLVWMVGSFAFVPMRDGGRKGAGARHWAGYLMDVGMGAFAGLFLAAPAFALYMGANFGRRDGGSGMADLATYLSCETVAWRKFSAVVP